MGLTLLPHSVRAALDWLFLEGRGYQFWSGIGLGIAWPLIYWKHHNCHHRLCPFLGHADERGNVICRKHRRGWTG